MNLSLLFPPRRCWLQAAKLTIAAYSGTISIVFFFWLFLLELVLLATEGHIFPWLSVVALACFVAGWLWFLMIRWFWTVFLRILWRKPPAWITPRAGIRAAWYGYSITVMATLPLMVIPLILMLAGVPTEEWLEPQLIDQQSIMVLIIVRYFWLFWIIAAYLLHWFPLPAGPAAPAGNHAIAK